MNCQYAHRHTHTHHDIENKSHIQTSLLCVCAEKQQREHLSTSFCVKTWKCVYGRERERAFVSRLRPRPAFSFLHQLDRLTGAQSHGTRQHQWFRKLLKTIRHRHAIAESSTVGFEENNTCMYIVYMYQLRERFVRLTLTNYFSCAIHSFFITFCMCVVFFFSSFLRSLDGGLFFCSSRFCSNRAQLQYSIVFWDTKNLFARQRLWRRRYRWW